ncbi:hypothetical protein TIFTF001_015294 [Ficus carica]|uniref:Uncharacterized protein n=1 Tax=Ficus carica TaxID=3494 RepID=A0AA88DIL9_FICCA|nr:hypothetical protein TIFTF001_015294 [Ficus carica]
MKLDELFRDVTATGAKSWASTSDLLPLLYRQISNTEDNITQEVVSDDSEEKEHEDVEDSNRKEKVLGPSRKRFKKGKKPSTTAKLSKILDELCKVIKNRSSYIRTDPLGCSVEEVLDKLATLSGCEPMTPLFKLGARLLTKKANREIFVALRQPEYQIEWLKDQQSHLEI